MMQATLVRTPRMGQGSMLVVEPPEHAVETTTRVEPGCRCPSQALHCLCPLDAFGFAKGRTMCEAYLDSFTA